MTGGWQPVPLALTVDLTHGGRWTSLRGAGREWLWTNASDVVARRPQVAPGAPFVDAGGVEECFPCVRGTPDHGDVWSRVWTGSPDDAYVDRPDGSRLRRTTAVVDGVLEVGYEVTGEPGTRFVHAVHALLDLGASARLHVPGASSVLVLDDDAGAVRPWPSGLDALGPDDGTATCVLLPRCHEATVVDGDDALTFAWGCPEQEDLCSLMLWRNLGGWPDDGPYRSVGLEPMLGRTADLDAGDPRDTVRLGPDGRVRWLLRVSAYAQEGLRD